MNLPTYRDESNRLHSGFFRKYNHIIDQIRNGRRDGFYFFDDFNSGGAAQVSTAHTWYGGSPTMTYLTYATASTTVKPSNTAADKQIGVLEIGGCDADNDECYITFDNTYIEAMCQAQLTANYIRPFIFEARVRFSNVSGNASKFIGLHERAAPATADMANSTGAIADKSYVGFRALVADPNGMDAVYRTNGGGGEIVHVEAATNDNLDVVADTFKKFGVLFDGQRVWYYEDGRKVETTGVLPTATDFPDGVGLVPKLMVRAEAALTGMTIGLDWWSLLRVDGELLK